MIYDYQLAAFDKLLSVAKACFAIQRHTLPIRPRTNTLIIGPSGTGKTHLARAVAAELEAEFLSVSVAEWILLGCTGRGGTPSWPVIVGFLKRNHKKSGLVLFVDEIDKVSGGTAWETLLRAETFSLLDLRIPTGLNDEDGTSLSDDELAKAQDVLSNRTLVLAAGAFQHIWEDRSRPTVGFGSVVTNTQETNLNHLAATLPRELVNRFRSDVIVLPQLQECDYRRMLEQSAEAVPVYLRNTFLRLGNQRIHGAVACQQGCRFLEELMLDTIIEEKSLLQLGDSPSPSDVDIGSAFPPALPAPSKEPDA